MAGMMLFDQNIIEGKGVKFLLFKSAYFHKGAQFTPILIGLTGDLLKRRLNPFASVPLTNYCNSG